MMMILKRMSNFLLVKIMNKKKVIIFIFIILFVQCIFSAPSYYGSTDYIQPDGTPISLIQVGDEYYHMVFFENQPVYYNRENKFWEFYSFEGNKLIESGKKAGIDSFVSLNEFKLKKNYSTEYDDLLDKGYEGTYYYPVILINFKDTSFTFDREEIFENLLNAQEYFYENSYGKFKIIFHVYGWYKSDMDKLEANVNISDFIRDVLIQQDKEITFDLYDNDGDSKVDNIVVIHQGQGQEYSKNPDDIWSHSSYFQSYISDEGILLDKYTMQPEKMVVDGNPKGASIGVLTHELGHVLGLPDLYDVDYSSNGIGKWGNMSFGCWNGNEIPGDSPSHFCSWSKENLDWINPLIINDFDSSVELTLSDYESTGKVLKYVNKNNFNEYFLFENREPKGFDSSLPGKGMIVYHVDNNGNQTNEFHKIVDIEEADADNALDFYEGDRGSEGDPFPGTTEKDEFSSWTDPNSNFYKGSLGPQLSKITLEEETIKFLINDNFIKNISSNYLIYNKKQEFVISTNKKIKNLKITLPKSIEYIEKTDEYQIKIEFLKIPDYTFPVEINITFEREEEVTINKVIYPFSYIKTSDGVSDNYLFLLREYGWNEKPGVKWEYKNGLYSVWSDVPVNFFNIKLY